MRCEGAAALEVVDRDATGLVSLAARAHLRSCPHCRRELAAQRRLSALDAEDRRSTRRGAFAVAAAGVIGALAVSGAIVAVTQRRRVTR